MYSYVLTRDVEEDLDRIHEYGVHKLVCYKQIIIMKCFLNVLIK